jgi:hypothetical protein
LHKAIQPVLSRISFYPLSQFDGKMKITLVSASGTLGADPPSAVLTVAEEAF